MPKLGRNTHVLAIFQTTVRSMPYALPKTLLANACGSAYLRGSPTYAKRAYPSLKRRCTPTRVVGVISGMIGLSWLPCPTNLASWDATRLLCPTSDSF
eukprot:6144596-Lingulodinium_polyedra.AAC.1